MTTFNEALAKHGTAKDAIHYALRDIYKYAHGNMTESFGPVAQWVLDNADAIHQYQTGRNQFPFQPHPNDDLAARVRALESHEASAEARVAELAERIRALQTDSRTDKAVNTLAIEIDELAERVQTLEDAPGPRPNEAEVSALRQRMDGLTELLEKLASLDTSDVLTALVRDVALLKDDRIIRSHPAARMHHIGALMEMFGTEPQTPEARKMLGLSPQTVATPEPVYEWVGND